MPEFLQIWSNFYFDIFLVNLVKILQIRSNLDKFLTNLLEMSQNENLAKSAQV